MTRSSFEFFTCGQLLRERGGFMRNSCLTVFVVIFVLFFMTTIGCGPEQQVQPPKPIKYLEPVCIQGTVQYRLPDESNLVPFANVKVTAWRHNETRNPFAEAMADAAGNYCLEVPLREYGVDIRVWGMVNLGNKSYTCTASENDIKLGKTTKKCGEDCATVNLVAECKEFIPTRRSK
ncbi:MAG: hypothetical protein JSW56_13730 [Deltaproteobacteria bacterium]|nr:MAG: hypothetical protein JSW56_13730 [Deltaproteobacteria bacterium]